MASLGKIARRTFLFGAAAIAGGVAFGYYYVNKPYANPLEGDLADGEATFNPYVKIAADNTITVIVPRAEMGQGVSTTLAALVAEELDVPLEAIKVEHGPASWAYYNSAMLEEGAPFAFFNDGLLAETVRTAMGTLGVVLGLQGTGGSSSTRDGYRQDAAGGRGGAPDADRGGGSEARRCRPASWKLRTARSCTRRQANRSPMARSRQSAAAIDQPSAPQLKDKSAWKAARQAAEARRHAGQGHRRTDLRRRCRPAGHAVRHGQAQPALLVETGQG